MVALLKGLAKLLLVLLFLGGILGAALYYQDRVPTTEPRARITVTPDPRNVGPSTEHLVLFEAKVNKALDAAYAHFDAEIGKLAKRVGELAARTDAHNKRIGDLEAPLKWLREEIEVLRRQLAEAQKTPAVTTVPPAAAPAAPETAATPAPEERKLVVAIPDDWDTHDPDQKLAVLGAHCTPFNPEWADPAKTKVVLNLLKKRKLSRERAIWFVEHKCAPNAPPPAEAPPGTVAKTDPPPAKGKCAPGMEPAGSFGCIAATF